MIPTIAPTTSPAQKSISPLLVVAGRYEYEMFDAGDMLCIPPEIPGAEPLSEYLFVCLTPHTQYRLGCTPIPPEMPELG